MVLDHQSSFHPEGNMNVFTKFHSNLSTFHSKLQIHLTTAGGKGRGSWGHILQDPWIFMQKFVPSHPFIHPDISLKTKFVNLLVALEENPSLGLGSPSQ